MKNTTIALLMGGLVLMLGILGLINGEGRILSDTMNIDLALDVARISLGILLIMAGLKSADASRGALGFFGAAYLGIFILGLLSPTLYGLLPSGLGAIDQMLHVAGGIVAMFYARAYTQQRAAI